MDINVFDIKDIVINSQHNKTSYHERKKEVVNNVHHGHYKLFYSELLFCSLYLKESVENKATVLYIGAAPGFQISLLSKLFPNTIWILYDAANFPDKLYYQSNIKIYNKLFLDEDLLEWKKKNIKNLYIISDIRSRGYNVNQKSKKEDELFQQAIKDDMYLQMKWVKELKPIKSSLKFRLPYGYDWYITENGEYFNYLDGICFKQPWAPQSSIECRLIPFDDLREKKWNFIYHEQYMMYHNSIIREKQKYYNLITKKLDLVYYDILLNDYDSVYTQYIILQYMKCKNISINYEKFNDIIKNIHRHFCDYNSPSIKYIRNQEIKSTIKK